MRTVTLGVSSVEETQRQMAAAFRGEKVGEFISFATVELLWKVLTAKRWDILRAMTGQGEMTIREIARRVGQARGGHGIAAMGGTSARTRQPGTDGFGGGGRPGLDHGLLQRVDTGPVHGATWRRRAGLGKRTKSPRTSLPCDRTLAPDARPELNTSQ